MMLSCGALKMCIRDSCIVGSNHAQQTSGGSAEDKIPGGMSERIVNGLEVIKVNENNISLSTARRLLRMVRADDTVIRLGGDEFVLLIEARMPPIEMCIRDRNGVWL